MRTAGIDIGSRTVKVVVVDGTDVVHQRVEDTGFDPLDVCRRMLDGVACERILATGYGRHLFREHWGCEAITEIKAVARGARALLPSCRAVVDIGGQDTKAIALDPRGKLLKFTMNDRCAAGTGRFLEVMALALSWSPAQFVEAAQRATRSEKLNSMCTVFAESEVISLVARGKTRDEIALGIHQAIATRTVALLKAVPLEGDILFTGGGALNDCLRRLIQDGIGRDVQVPEHPQTAAALGCALVAAHGTPTVASTERRNPPTSGPFPEGKCARCYSGDACGQAAAEHRRPAENS